MSLSFGSDVVFVIGIWALHPKNLLEVLFRGTTDNLPKKHQEADN
jgi:hypothetical protein